jgi:hypothetical protein
MRLHLDSATWHAGHYTKQGKNIAPQITADVAFPFDSAEEDVPICSTGTEQRKQSEQTGAGNDGADTMRPAACRASPSVAGTRGSCLSASHPLRGFAAMCTSGNAIMIRPACTELFPSTLRSGKGSRHPSTAQSPLRTNPAAFE